MKPYYEIQFNISLSFYTYYSASNTSYLFSRKYRMSTARRLKVYSILLILFASSSYAAAEPEHLSWWQVREDKRGILLGAQFGVGHQEPPIEAGSVPYTLSFLVPFGGRIYAGYQHNQYLAAELGYTPLLNTSYEGDSFWGPSHYNSFAVDLAAKLMLPANKYFDIFVKPGAALFYQEAYNKVRQTDPKPLIDSKEFKILPEIGAGVDVELLHNVIGNITYNHIFGFGNVHSSGLLAAGITVRIGV